MSSEAGTEISMRPAGLLPAKRMLIIFVGDTQAT
jgi:hypothetical protein